MANVCDTSALAALYHLGEVSANGSPEEKALVFHQLAPRARQTLANMFDDGWFPEPRTKEEATKRHDESMKWFTEWRNGGHRYAAPV